MRLTLYVVFLLIVCVGMTFGQIYSTDFTTANEDPLSLSGAWVTPTGDESYPMKVVSNAVQVSGLSEYTYGAAVRDAAYARTNGTREKLTISQFSGQGGATFFLHGRMAGKLNTSAGYAVRGAMASATTCTFSIVSHNGGWGNWGTTIVDAQQTTRTVADGDSLVVQYLGDASGTINVYHNTTLILSGTDLTYTPSAATTTYYGFSSYTYNDPFIFDDFSIDSITVASAATVDTVAPTVRYVQISPATVDTSTNASFIVSAWDSTAPSTGLDSIQVDTNDVAYWKLKVGTTKDTVVISPTVKFGTGAKTYRARVVDDSGNVTTTAAKTFTVGAGAVGGGSSALPIIAYYPQHAPPHLWPDSIDYDLMTHIVHAVYSAKTTSPYFSARVSAYDSLQAEYHIGNSGGTSVPIMRQLIDSAHAHGVKVLAGIGAVGFFDGGGEAAFDQVVADSGLAQTFVDHLDSWIKARGYDGVELNWEWPGGDDELDLARFIRMVKRKLNAWATPGEFAITAYLANSAPIWYDNAGIKDSVDYIMVEFYGLSLYQTNVNLAYTAAINRPAISGTYDGIVLEDSTWAGNLISPKALVGWGWDKSKIILGLGTYGLTYRRGGNTPISVGDPGTSLIFDQVFAYQNLAHVYTGRFAGRPVLWDATAKQPYLQFYDGAYSYFYTFEDSLSMAEKVQWVKDNGYGGIMVWDLSSAYISPDARWGGGPYDGDRWKVVRGARNSMGSDTVVAPPSPPVLVSPPNDTTNLKVGAIQLIWNSVSGVTQYQVQVAPTVAYVSPVVNVVTTDTTYWVPFSLIENQKYYWRVRAGNPNWGAYSSSYNFTTTQTAVDTPLAPTLVSPANDTTGQALSTTIRWQPNSSDTVDITAWGVQVATDTNMVYLVVNNQSYPDTALTLYNLAASTKYYWRVKGYNLAIPGPYSTIRSFTTTTTPAVFGYRTSLVFDPSLKAGGGQWTNTPQPYEYKRRAADGELPSAASIPGDLVVDFYGGYKDSAGVHRFLTEAGVISNAEVVSKFDAQINTLTKKHNFSGGLTVPSTAPVSGLIKKVIVSSTNIADSLILAAGSNVTLTPSGSTVTIAASTATNISDATVDTAKADIFFDDSGADDVRLELGRAGTAQSYFRNNEANNSYWESTNSNLFIRNGSNASYYKLNTSGDSEFLAYGQANQVRVVPLTAYVTENDSLFAIRDSAAANVFKVGSRGTVTMKSKAAPGTPAAGNMYLYVDSAVTTNGNELVAAKDDGGIVSVLAPAAYGTIWTDTSGLVLDIIAADSAHCVVGLRKDGIASQYTTLTDSSITVNIAGNYLVSFNVSFSAAGGSVTLNGHIYVDDVEVRPIGFNRTVSATTVGSAGGSGVITLTKGQVVEVKLQSTANADITIQNLALTVTRID